MLLIPCPWCGPRNDTEFSYGGESGIVRPKNPQELSDEEWADYLYMRNNTRGNHVEQWCHSAGCRRWFDLARDTVTNSVTDVLPNSNPLRRERNDAV
jgi:sarcosine oxidase subunit delta